MKLAFEVLHKDAGSNARLGQLKTAHGVIETPIFMPVGTNATVKTVHQRELVQDIKAQIILGNSYHLYLRPGTDTLQGAGGLHNFMNWKLPILTDSGGYQVYSLAHNRKIDEQGVIFQSHIDGSKHTFTAENVIQLQRKIGADIIMAFDECPPYPSEYDYVRESMHLTHRWLDRCYQELDQSPPIYGYPQIFSPIVQGGTYHDLRKQSAEYIAGKKSIIKAIGGLSVGEPHHMMYEISSLVCNILPEQDARYLMGVGTPENLLQCIARGVDMFDCVLPTRNARHGLLYTSRGIINIKNKKWANHFEPIDANLHHSYVSTSTSLAYLRHLFLTKEYLGPQIASIHNLTFFLHLMSSARYEIAQDRFAIWMSEQLPILTKRL